ncbi:MAG: hypothetical protein OER77_14085 [Myxococcales bacterium]|nr:hypothetical protein [Myxococcales bacterium]
MAVEFLLEIDDAHLLELSRRWRQAGCFRLVSIAVRTLGIVLMAGLTLLSVQKEYWWMLPVLIGLTVVFIFAPWFDKAYSLRRFRKSPFRGDQLAVTLSNENVSFEGTRSGGQLEWSSFTKAVQFSDGFLLFQGPDSPTWLPSSTLTNGIPDEVATIVKAKITDFRTK